MATILINADPHSSTPAQQTFDGGEVLDHLDGLDHGPYRNHFFDVKASGTLIESRWSTDRHVAVGIAWEARDGQLDAVVDRLFEKGLAYGIHFEHQQVDISGRKFATITVVYDKDGVCPAPWEYLSWCFSNTRTGVLFVGRTNSVQHARPSSRTPRLLMWPKGGRGLLFADGDMVTLYYDGSAGRKRFRDAYREDRRGVNYASEHQLLAVRAYDHQLTSIIQAGWKEMTSGITGGLGLANSTHGMIDRLVDPGLTGVKHRSTLVLPGTVGGGLVRVPVEVVFLDNEGEQIPVAAQFSNSVGTEWTTRDPGLTNALLKGGLSLKEPNFVGPVFIKELQ